MTIAERIGDKIKNRKLVYLKCNQGHLFNNQTKSWFITDPTTIFLECDYCHDVEPETIFTILEKYNL